VTVALRALLFDVDGTLTENEEVHRDAFNRAFREHGLDWEWPRELYRDLLVVTGGKERIRHYLERFHSELLACPDLERWIASLHEDKTRLYAERVASGGLRLRPGVRRLLREVRRAGLRLGIATTTGPGNVLALIESTLGPHGTEWFDVIGAGDCVSAKKPAPDIYRWVLREMSLPPSACLAVEDSTNGLRASLQADVATVVTISSYTQGEDFSGAVAVLSDLGEPDRPFSLLQGEAFGKGWVDVDLLRRWHSHAARTRAEA
jgi:beta-phosphoglucomutase-like phosphatase (HAD superfamily)